jgi:hypothetical protein
MIDPIHTTEFYCSKLTTSPLLGSSSRFGNDTNYTNNQSYSSYLNTDAKDDNCIYYRIENNFDSGDVTLSKTHVPSPNIALLSLILLIGTCVMALALKKLRRSVFFGAYVRRTFSDVGMLISIILMVTVDYLIQSKTGLKTQVIILALNSLYSLHGNNINIINVRSWIYQIIVGCQLNIARGSCHHLALN